MGVFLLFLRFFEAFLLYVFLIVIFYYLWKFFSQSTPKQLGSTNSIITFGILDSEAKIHHLKEFKIETIKIGRGSQCDLILNDPSVSGRHATISYTDEQWWIEDEGSRNGTYLNNNKLTNPTILVNEDMIRFGDERIKIIL
jgi:pSer/pThr/pTyr-binding forkhead associated (FHA) protein